MTVHSTYFSCLLFLLWVAKVCTTPFASALPAGQVEHESGGEEYVAILASNGPHAPDVLKRIGLSPEHMDVRHVFNNSAFRGFSAHMQSHCLDALGKMSDVLHLEKSIITTSHSNTVQKTIRPNSPWGLQRVSSSGSLFGDPKSMSFTYSYSTGSTLGSGVDIYIVDTGISTTNLVFGGRARMGYSFTSDASDGDGHGTHVAGTAGGAVVGVASGASLIGVKVLGADGSGTTSDSIAGIDFVVRQHDARKAADPTSFRGSILSMSWGLQGVSRVIQTAITAALDHGVHVSMAAGNSGGDACQYSPSAAGGTASAAVSVGSIGPYGMISSFSNTGSCVDLYAPGEDVLSAWIGGDNYLKFLDGTSMACPHVTGVMAYLMAMDQSGKLGASPRALKNKLLEMSLKGAALGDTNEGDAKRLLNNGMTGGVASGGRVRLGSREFGVHGGTRRDDSKRREAEELVSRMLWQSKMHLAPEGKNGLRY